jgi:hypothetical protein
MRKLRIVTLGVARGGREWPLNDGQIPNFRGVRVHASSGYNRVEGNRRGLVSALPPKLSTLRFANFSIAGVWWGFERCATQRYAYASLDQRTLTRGWAGVSDGWSCPPWR